MAERVGWQEAQVDAHPEGRHGSHLRSAAPNFGDGDSRLEAVMEAEIGSIGPVIAQASRQARAGSESWAEAYGAASVGQFTVAFVDWIRRECEREGITHIEFLARDGLVPYQVARALPEDYFAGVHLDYLNANRRAWGLAAAVAVGIDPWLRIGLKDDLAFLLHAADRVPFSSTMARCGLDLPDLPMTSSLSTVDPEHPLTPAQVKTWADLLGSGNLNRKIEAASAERARLLRDFLRQRQLPKERIALVDIGWRGQQAWLISAVVEEVTGEAPLNLHFGADGPDPEIDSMVEIRRFALDDTRDPHPMPAPVLCLETYLAPDTPRLVEYRRARDGVVHEVFETVADGSSKRTKHVLGGGAVRVATEMPPVSQLTSLSGCRSGVRSLLGELWNSPSRSEVEVVHRLDFEMDDSGQIVVPIVAPYVARELVRRGPDRRLWPEGSLTVTSQPMRLLMTRVLARRSS